MVNKDRERLMLSAGITLVGYAIIFVLMMGLKWPPDIPFQSVSPPVSVYVSLQGAALNEVTGSKPAPTVIARQPKLQPQPPAPTASENNSPKESSSAALSPQPRAQTVPQASAGQSVPPQESAAPVPSEATAIPHAPNIPTTMTSSAGPAAGGIPAPSNRPGAAPRSGGPATGPASATPGVNYPTGGESSAAPPQGGGGSATQPNPGQSQIYYGQAGSTSGNFFNPELAAAAGSTSSAAGNASAESTAAQKPSTAGSASSPTGSAGGGTGGSGTQTSASSGPKIAWKASSSPRKVLHEPDPLVIPSRYLNDIPPTITLNITFQVTPLGSVNALNVTPSLGYPELDNMLERWMEQWRFQPITGNQVAQGTLQYVIQATTAR